MEERTLAWYGWLSSLTQGAAFRLQEVTERVDLPVVTAIVFGLIGATAGLQLAGFAMKGVGMYRGSGVKP